MKKRIIVEVIQLVCEDAKNSVHDKSVGKRDVKMIIMMSGPIFYDN